MGITIPDLMKDLLMNMQKILFFSIHSERKVMGSWKA